MIALYIICSVFTPYYSEIVLYSLSELQKKNEDGISILFYLQKIFPGTSIDLLGTFILSFAYIVLIIHFPVWDINCLCLLELARIFFFFG